VNWQQIISLAIVAVSAGWLLRGLLRRRKFSFPHDTYCGCSIPGESSARKSSIVFHAHKGERPVVFVQMK